MQVQLLVQVLVMHEVKSIKPFTTLSLTVRATLLLMITCALRHVARAGSMVRGLKTFKAG